MALAFSRMGPTLVEAFTAPSRLMVPPDEANSTHTVPIPGLQDQNQDQDQDMDGVPVSSEPGVVEPSLGNITTIVGPPIVVPMDVELGELPPVSKPELTQEGEGVKDT
ncbi:hypothetical protein BU15DRAFT_68035 [Melanogaster broomeanus]|nr:hypothetical protein BU15DRAFT_68035 [Melanogaster broomeanus]